MQRLCCPLLHGVILSNCFGSLSDLVPKSRLYLSCSVVGDCDGQVLTITILTINNLQVPGLWMGGYSSHQLWSGLLKRILLTFALLGALVAQQGENGGLPKNVSWTPLRRRNRFCVSGRTNPFSSPPNHSANIFSSCVYQCRKISNPFHVQYLYFSPLERCKHLYSNLPKNVFYNT